MALRYRKLSQNVTIDDLITEMIRKTIHIFVSFILVFAKYWYKPTLYFIATVTILYCISEILRMYNISIPIITKITKLAARKRDADHFILGPVLLALGVMLSLILFPFHIAAIAILSLSLGDGFASLVGKIYGQKKVYRTTEKTYAGTLACFIAVFIPVLIISGFRLGESLIVALVVAAIEALPLKDFDNLFIPLVAGYVSLFLQI